MVGNLYHNFAGRASDVDVIGHDVSSAKYLINFSDGQTGIGGH